MFKTDKQTERAGISSWAPSTLAERPLYRRRRDWRRQDDADLVCSGFCIASTKPPSTSARALSRLPPRTLAALRQSTDLLKTYEPVTPGICHLKRLLALHPYQGPSLRHLMVWFQNKRQTNRKLHSSDAPGGRPKRPQPPYFQRASRVCSAHIVVAEELRVRRPRRQELPPGYPRPACAWLHGLEASAARPSFSISETSISLVLARVLLYASTL